MHEVAANSCWCRELLVSPHLLTAGTTLEAKTCPLPAYNCKPYPTLFPSTLFPKLGRSLATAVLYNSPAVVEGST